MDDEDWAAFESAGPAEGAPTDTKDDVSIEIISAPTDAPMAEPQVNGNATAAGNDADDWGDFGGFEGSALDEKVSTNPPISENISTPVDVPVTGQSSVEMGTSAFDPFAALDSTPSSETAGNTLQPAPSADPSADFLASLGVSDSTLAPAPEPAPAPAPAPEPAPASELTPEPARVLEPESEPTSAEVPAMSNDGGDDDDDFGDFGDFTSSPAKPVDDSIANMAIVDDAVAPPLPELPSETSAAVGVSDTAANGNAPDGASLASSAVPPSLDSISADDPFASIDAPTSSVQPIAAPAGDPSLDKFMAEEPSVGSNDTKSEPLDIAIGNPIDIPTDTVQSLETKVLSTQILDACGAGEPLESTAGQTSTESQPEMQNGESTHAPEPSTPSDVFTAFAHDIPDSTSPINSLASPLGSVAMKSEAPSVDDFFAELDSAETSSSIANPGTSNDVAPELSSPNTTEPLDNTSPVMPKMSSPEVFNPTNAPAAFDDPFAEADTGTMSMTSSVPTVSLGETGASTAPAIEGALMDASSVVSPGSAPDALPSSNAEETSTEVPVEDPMQSSLEASKETTVDATVDVIAETIAETTNGEPVNIPDELSSACIQTSDSQSCEVVSSPEREVETPIASTVSDDPFADIDKSTPSVSANTTAIVEDTTVIVEETKDTGISEPSPFDFTETFRDNATDMIRRSSSASGDGEKQVDQIEASESVQATDVAHSTTNELNGSVQPEISVGVAAADTPELTVSAPDIGTDDNDDFGDFGDFESSPPKPSASMETAINSEGPESMGSTQSEGPFTSPKKDPTLGQESTMPYAVQQPTGEVSPEKEASFVGRFSASAAFVEGDNAEAASPPPLMDPVKDTEPAVSSAENGASGIPCGDDNDDFGDFGDFGDFQASPSKPTEDAASNFDTAFEDKADPFAASGTGADAGQPSEADLSFGDFTDATPASMGQPTEPAAAGSEDWGDFGESSAGQKEAEPSPGPVATAAAATASSVEDEDFGDFGSFSEAPTGEAEPVTKMEEPNHTAESNATTGDDDEFGDFGDFSEAPADVVAAAGDSDSKSAAGTSEWSAFGSADAFQSAPADAPTVAATASAAASPTKELYQSAPGSEVEILSKLLGGGIDRSVGEVYEDIRSRSLGIFGVDVPPAQMSSAAISATKPPESADTSSSFVELLKGAGVGAATATGSKFPSLCVSSWTHSEILKALIDSVPTDAPSPDDVIEPSQSPSRRSSGQPRDSNGSFTSPGSSFQGNSSVTALTASLMKPRSRSNSNSIPQSPPTPSTPRRTSSGRGRGFSQSQELQAMSVSKQGSIDGEDAIDGGDAEVVNEIGFDMDFLAGASAHGVAASAGSARVAGTDDPFSQFDLLFDSMPAAPLSPAQFAPPSTTDATSTIQPMDFADMWDSGRDAAAGSAAVAAVSDSVGVSSPTSKLFGDGISIGSYGAASDFLKALPDLSYL